MSALGSRWAVVATVDEPPVLVQCFAAWHLALGAAQVFLYFDRPDDPAADLLAQMAGVTVVRCDARYWAGARPARHQVRQTRNANHAYACSGADWLLHCDADEFLWTRGDVAPALALCGHDCDAAIVPVAERVYHGAGGDIFAGVFRRPFAGTPARGAALFGPDYALTGRGLTGHAQGKVFVRTGRDLVVAVHRPRPRADLQLCPMIGVDLLHFDGLTPLQWVLKLWRKAADHARGGIAPSPHRQAQMDALAIDHTRGVALHDRLKRGDHALLAALRRRNLLLAPRFDPAASLPKRPDLSPRSYDRALRARYGADFPAFIWPDWT